MYSRILICVSVCAVSSVGRAADVQFQSNTVIHFASAQEGRETLIAKDAFVLHLSPFDRSARLKTDKRVSEEEFLAFIGGNVTDWTKEEMQAVQAAVNQIKPGLRDFRLAFPAKVQLIRTTGAEEGNAAYTRGTAIIISKAELAKNEQALAKLICHELFHILSRENPDLREKLYEIIGFTRCEEIELPPELVPRKITDPDAPRNDHFISIEIGGHQCFAVPILISSAETYDIQRGGEFFDYLNFQFLVMEKSSVPQRLRAVYERGVPKLVGPKGGLRLLREGWQKYAIHYLPGRNSCRQFALLVLGGQNVPPPEILQKMRETFLHSPQEAESPAATKTVSAGG